MFRGVLFLLAVAVGVSIQCKPGFHNFGGSCYKFILTGNASYNQAQAQCKKFGINVNLATIRCKKENDFVYGLMRGNQPYLSLVVRYKDTAFYKPRIHWLNVWIGLHNVKEVRDRGGRHWSGNWFSDDKCNRYRNYGPGEPNNNADYNEGCVDLIHNDPSASQRGKWNDLPCDRPLLGAICEEQTTRSGGACNLKPCPETRILPEPPVVRRDLSKRPAAYPMCNVKPVGKCSSGFKNIGGSCYKIELTFNATHSEAQAACRRLGPNVNLATLRCKVENDCVYRMLLTDLRYQALIRRMKNTRFYKLRPWFLDAWIGLHNSGRNPAWKGNWFIDDCHKYRNFGAGEPNNNQKGCVEMMHMNVASKTSKWNDLECDHKLVAAICEEHTTSSGRACGLNPCRAPPKPIRPPVSRDRNNVNRGNTVNNVNHRNVVNNVNHTNIVNNVNHNNVVNNVNHRNVINNVNNGPLPVPRSALEKTVEIQSANGFYQQYFTFNAREFLSALIEYVTKTTEKCQDLRCKELRAKEAQGKL